MAGVTEESALYDKHQAAAAAALTAFSKAAMGEPELVKEFEDRLKKGRVRQHALLLAPISQPAARGQDMVLDCCRTKAARVHHCAAATACRL